MRKKIIICSSIILVIIISYFITSSINSVRDKFFIKTCANAGEMVGSEYKKCCRGLKTISSNYFYNGKCNLGVGGLLPCAPCGNGVCEAVYYEDKCSCPKDCQ